MQTLARKTMPPGFDFAWAGQSLEEIKAGTQAGSIFALSVIIGVLAGLIPATMASRLKIVDALRRVA